MNMQAKYPNKQDQRVWDRVHLTYPVRKFPTTGVSSECKARSWVPPPETLKSQIYPLDQLKDYLRDYNVTKELTSSQTTEDYGFKQPNTNRHNKHTSCTENLYINNPNRRQWRRGSMETREQTPVAVVRVVLPDECRGSIRRVPVPCRPGARARDLCRALTHAAAITNPQDYALFALHDGHETMLNENDCPQEVMSEKSGQNFTLAYRRIDAKIAWPQQALSSYP